MKSESETVKRTSSSRLENFLTRTTSSRDEEEMMANGVLSLAEESTLRGIDFCPSVAQSQYTTGTSEMEEYNKAFLEKVAASVRENSMGRVERPAIEETAEELDTTQESSYDEDQQQSDNRTATAESDRAAGQEKSKGASSSMRKEKKKKNGETDIFEEVVKVFEMLVSKLKEVAIMGSGKIKECYDSAGTNADRDGKDPPGSLYDCK